MRKPSTNGRAATMANWNFRVIRCPRCKDHKREPVNLHQPPPLNHFSLAGAENHIYEQQCHSCQMVGASAALLEAYSNTFKRLVHLCEQKEKGGQPCPTMTRC